MSMTREQASRKKVFQPFETPYIYQYKKEMNKVAKDKNQPPKYTLYNTSNYQELLKLSRKRHAKSNPQKNVESDNISVRTIVDIKNELVFGLDGFAMGIVPSHYDLREKCLAAGDTYFNKDDEVCTVSMKSSCFEPTIQSIQFILLKLYEEGYKLAPEVTLLEIYPGVCTPTYHRYTREKLIAKIETLKKHYAENDFFNKVKDRNTQEISPSVSKKHVDFQNSPVDDTGKTVKANKRSRDNSPSSVSLSPHCASKMNLSSPNNKSVEDDTPPKKVRRTPPPAPAKSNSARRGLFASVSSIEVPSLPIRLPPQRSALIPGQENLTHFLSNSSSFSSSLFGGHRETPYTPQESPVTHNPLFFTPDLSGFATTDIDRNPNQLVETFDSDDENDMTANIARMR